MPESENVEQAVALALLRQEVAALTAAHQKTEAQIQGLLDAWNGSKWVFRAVAAVAGLVTAIGAIVAAYKGFAK
jgi:hypothetical protein